MMSMSTCFSYTKLPETPSVPIHTVSFRRLLRYSDSGHPPFKIVLVLMDVADFISSLIQLSVTIHVHFTV